ncbi:MAG: GGDEF domain-containing protein [Planctomycetota bacterium]
MTAAIGARSGRSNVRIILIGNTGFASALRAHSGIEVIEVDSTLEAIGQASVGGERCVIVLGEIDLDSDRRSTFVGALRAVNDGVRIYTPMECTDWPAWMVDRLVDSAERLVEAAKKRDDPSDPEQAFAGESGSDIGPWSQAAEALLSGHSVLEVVLDSLRVWAGDETLMYHPADEGVSGASSVPVAHGDRTLGVLVGTVASPGKLAEAAKHLALWLTLEAQHHQLTRAAFRDPLTGAYNRRGFELAFDRAIARARDERRSVSLMLLDLDDFKRYNDEYGHEAGDAVLVSIVDLVRALVRPADLVCRIGGDEFAVILDDQGKKRVEGSQMPREFAALADRFAAALKVHECDALGKDSAGKLSLTGGLASYPWDGVTRAELLRTADRLLLEAKASGKGRIRLGRFSDDCS